MNVKYFLLFVASLCFVDLAPLAAPVPIVAPVLAADALDSVTTTRQNCQQAKTAVVTVYAGNEIGSGSIVSAEGLVITNQHVMREVLQSRSNAIAVRTADGRRFPGQLLKTDSKNDLALIRLNASEAFPTIPLATGEGIRAGQRVCAIGSPYGKPGVTTEGTFTSVRSNGDLKSSVVLRPGNSGGPLLNARGEMIGVNKAIWQSSTGANSGISFATSAPVTRTFIASSGTTIAARPVTHLPVPDAIEPPSNRRLGVTVDTRSLIVQRVESGSPAATSGLKPGDRLVAINGGRLLGFEQLQSFLNQQPRAATLTIARNQRVATVRILF